MPDDTMGDLDHPASQIPLSGDLIEKLGSAALDYANALWSAAQHRDADADEMTTMIREINERFEVDFPETGVNKWQEIFRNSGDLVTIISEDRVLAGAPPGADALEEPYASHGPSIDDD